MLKNFVTTLKRFGTSSALNIAGLAVAFTTAYLILVQVYHDYSYNRGIADAERIFVAEMASPYEAGKFQPYLSRPVGELICKDNPHVERYGMLPPHSFPSDVVIRRGESYERGSVDYVWGANVAGLDVLGVSALRGSLDRARDGGSGNVVITESAAARLGVDIDDALCFGDSWNADDVGHVAAIIPDFAPNTDWHCVEIFKDFGNQYIDNSTEWNFIHYIKLHSVADTATCMEVARGRIREYYRNRYSDRANDSSVSSEIESIVNGFRIIPITETYFSRSSLMGAKGNSTTTATLLAIAVLVVAIAFINFINFFMAMVPQRLRGVNTHRAYGCSLRRARLGIVLESVGLVALSLVGSVVLLVFIQTSFIAGFISSPVGLLHNPGLLSLLAVSGLLLAVAAGIYPAYYITSFPLAMASKGGFGSSKTGKRLRTALVGFQFVISITLIVCSALIKIQHSYMMSYDMGFNRDNLLTSWIPGRLGSSFEARESFAAELKKNPQIVDVAFANGRLVSPGRMGWGRPFKGENINFQCYPVSYNFLDFMGVEIAEGVNFSKADELDTLGTFIFNASAKEEFGLTLADRLKGHSEDTRIAGFCKDFNYKPLQYKTAPFAFYVFGPNAWKPLNQLYVRTAATADVQQVVEYIRDAVHRLSPDTNMENVDVKLFDSELGMEYAQERKLTTLVSLFSLVSILISLMGVFGLVFFETQYRRKEIGIRRVHGASIGEILAMLNTRFVRIVLACFVIAVPASYFAIDRWLGAFAYRTPIHWWVFVLALLVVLLITVATVTLRSLRTATENPTEAIRTE